MHDSDGQISDLLRILLGEDSRMLEFATAVAIHLRDAPGNRQATDEVVSRLVRVLAPFRDEDEPPPPDVLLADPELLASFFQNADLLDPSAPETSAVARLVTSALERASEQL
jgi:hypothetical protein